jgi:hypothetical protein
MKKLYKVLQKEIAYRDILVEACCPEEAIEIVNNMEPLQFEKFEITAYDIEVSDVKEDKR